MNDGWLRVLKGKPAEERITISKHAVKIHILIKFTLRPQMPWLARHRTQSRSQIVKRYRRCSRLLPLLMLAYLISFGKIAAAQDAYQRYNIGFDNNLLSISAREADLKKILFKVADTTDTVVQVPGSLDREISITIKNLSVKETFHRLLKEFNYVVIYSGKDKSKADVRKVIVFAAPKKLRRTNRTNNRIARTIRSLERRLETLKRSLSRVKESSPRGKSYLARIRRIENQIAKLEGRMN